MDKQKTDGLTMDKWIIQIKRHYAIGTGDFSYKCKVAHHESTNFPFIKTYQHHNVRVKKSDQD